MVPMRDGVQLAADVYLPSKDGLAAVPGRFPVILSRTPYDKEARDFDPPYGWVRDSVHHGYAAVIQDVRGTHASGGAFNPIMDEGWGEHQDGVDTAAWLVRQPWSDGHVGTSGMSYMGATQVMLALTHPPGYVTGFIEVPAVNQFTESFLFVGGAFNLGATLPWAMMMSRDAAAHLPSPQRAAVLDDLASIPDLDWDGKAAIRELQGHSLRDVKAVRHLPFWQGWLDHQDDPWYFRDNDIHDRLQDVATPLFLWGGWYDLFLRQVTAIYEGVTREAHDPAVRANTRMLIGPWPHDYCAECDKLPNADVDDSAYQTAWMDRWFKGTPNPLLDYPVVLYVMGENRWRAENTWPLTDAKLTSYYLHSKGGANSVRGNGLLSAVAPTAEAADRFTYDPRHPVESHMGRSLIGGRVDQSSVEGRTDVLIYSTPRLTQDVEVTGEIKATLYAASSATDTDWHVKLVDVYPDGRAYNLADGIVRARYRHSRTAPQPLVPNAIESYEIDLWATSNVFKKGHRIRIEVASSDFWNVDRNPNAYIDLTRATERDFVIARQTIYHDALHPSRIDLPIVPTARPRNWIATPFSAAGTGRGYNKGVDEPHLPPRELPAAELQK